MKKIILLLTTLFCVAFLYAQNEKKEEDTPLPNEDFFNQAELVFEGVFLRMVANYDTKGNRNREDIYRINSVRVLKVFKGDQSLVGDTVYITEKGGVLGSENWNAEKYDTEPFCPHIFYKNEVPCYMYPFDPQIFFLVTSDIPDIKNSKYSDLKKYKHLSKYTRNFYGHLFTHRMYVCGNAVGGLNDLFFPTREEFYNYMRQFQGFNVPEPVKPLENTQQEKREYIKVKIDSAKYDKENLKESKKKSPKKKKRRE